VTRRHTLVLSSPTRSSSTSCTQYLDEAARDKDSSNARVGIFVLEQLKESCPEGYEEVMTKRARADFDETDGDIEIATGSKMDD
jgi:hypothetical protein